MVLKITQTRHPKIVVDGQTDRRMDRLYRLLNQRFAEPTQVAYKIDSLASGSCCHQMQYTSALTGKYMFTEFNPNKPNVTSQPYQLGQSILVLRVVG